MELKVDSDTEFGQLFDKLAEEIISAAFYDRLLNDILDAKPQYEEEFAESNTFWSLVTGALDDARMLYLCRVYDQHRDTLSLRNFLMTVKANPQYFSEDCFRKRYGPGPHLDSLATRNEILSSTQLDADIALVDNVTPLVLKLTQRRGNLVAHTSRAVALRRCDLLDKNPIVETEVSTLIDNAFGIINRYADMYKGTGHARQVLGHEDYKNLLEMIRLGLKKWDEDNLSRPQ